MPECDVCDNTGRVNQSPAAGPGAPPVLCDECAEPAPSYARLAEAFAAFLEATFGVEEHLRIVESCLLIDARRRAWRTVGAARRAVQP